MSAKSNRRRNSNIDNPIPRNQIFPDGDEVFTAIEWMTEKNDLENVELNLQCPWAPYACPPNVLKNILDLEIL